MAFIGRVVVMKGMSVVVVGGMIMIHVVLVERVLKIIMSRFSGFILNMLRLCV